MLIAIYGRVSTSQQEAGNQLLALREFARRLGWTIVREFVDDAISGGTANRPAFKAMMQAAHRREFDLLLFWSLDRLSREGALATLQHLQRLTAAGVEWRSFTEQYLDSCGVFRDAVLSILATIAKQERVRLSERTKAGLARVRARGKTLGRPRLDAKRRELYALRASEPGISIRSLARRLELSKTTVERFLRESHDA